ncbi:hypothetical protein HPB47_027780 [Ixodes persulcatus]|uniref:Uncharacterized protein n=1 Tax=Ixodes persulcatus TaxID=34615 RepID=A0AC60PWI8_IXOPE|nr:hypothetical protein HPB47_027780 [Ixodes persulcatus]
MATKKKQSPRFTADEISILSGLVGKHKTIIECKKTDSVSSNLKNETWEKLCNEYNCLPGVSPRDSNQLKKCWGNLKQKWKNERSDERRKTHKTGGGPPPTPMSAISVLVGAVAGHMATRLDNDNDSDGAAYLPPVQNEPVVRLLEGMVDCDPVYEYAGDHYQPASPSMDVAEPGASSSTAAATEAAPDPLTEQTTPAPAAASSCSSDRVAATPDEARPPRGRVVLLEQALSAENDVRSSVLRAESAIRIKLLEEEQQIKAAEHQMKVAKHQMKVAEHRVRLQVEQTNLKIAEWKLRELQQGGEK